MEACVAGGEKMALVVVGGEGNGKGGGGGLRELILPEYYVIAHRLQSAYTNCMTGEVGVGRAN